MMSVGPGATIMLKQLEDGTWHAVGSSHKLAGLSWAGGATPIDACAEVLHMMGIQKVNLASSDSVARLGAALDRAAKAVGGDK